MDDSDHWAAKAEIRELIDSYTEAVCERDAELFASLWVADGRWSITDMAELSAIEGREAIVERWTSGMAGHPFVFLLCNPVRIRVDGDEARTQTYSYEIVRDAEGKGRRAAGRYEDTFVRQAGRWLFKERVWTKLHTEAAEVPLPDAVPA